jgi:hypothetical protein
VFFAFVMHHCVHHVIEEVVMIANDYRVQGIGIIMAISSNGIVKYDDQILKILRISLFIRR